MRDVDMFVEDKGLQDKVDLIKRGALVAQDPTNFESIELLEEEEKEALRFEATHKWRHPALLYVTIVVCSIGAAVQGWDQTGRYETEAFFMSSTFANLLQQWRQFILPRGIWHRPR